LIRFSHLRQLCRPARRNNAGQMSLHGNTMAVSRSNHGRIVAVAFPPRRKTGIQLAILARENRGHVSFMSKLSSVFLAATAILFLVLAFMTPAMAEDISTWRIWDPVHNMWVHSDGTPFTPPTTHRPGKSTIPREVVDFPTKYKPGTIVVETSKFRLYFVLPDGKAMAYGIGVGRDGFRWSGQHVITRKAEWPGWTPPAQMRKRVPDLPAYMPGGPDNPLGARALYIGATLYRIHGTSEPWTIGQKVSSGCIRLTNADIIDLFSRAKVGDLVVVEQ
jgi:lipoprotein-anchoring transpeptidase ErfK/SrfK